jgi:hypothetical protein
MRPWGHRLITAAARRAALHLDPAWTLRLLLGAGALVSLAAYLYLDHSEAESAAAQFRAATQDRARAIHREIESRAILLGVITRLLARDGASVESLQDVLDGYRGNRGEGVTALWAPWDGVGKPPDWRGVHRFTSASTPLAASAPAWLDDALRRTAYGNRTITVPAATPEGAELLIFAAPVSDARGHLKGIAMIAARVSEVVEQGLGNIDSAGIGLVAEDVTLGGRRVYANPSRMGNPTRTASQNTFDVPIRFVDRVWTLRAVSVPGDSHMRSILLVGCWSMAFVAVALARAGRFGTAMG